MTEIGQNVRTRSRAARALRDSAVPYLASLMVTAMLAAWANYLSPLVYPEGFIIKGQALVIVIPFLGFPITFVLWLVYRGRPTRSPWLLIFLGGLAVAWIVQMVILRAHGDQYPHLVWLFLPILAMLAFKAPSAGEAWTTVEVFAWCAVVMLVVTRILEMAGLIPVFHIEQWIIEWEKKRYWLPLSDLFGVDGRWPGPFGYNSKTGFVATLLVLIGLARLTWRSWIFVTIGGVVILLTGGRGAALSLAAGLLVLVVFAVRGPISRIPTAIRAAIGSAVVLGFGLVLLLSPASTTGRFGPKGIWLHFYNLWLTSPWVGVGQVGILGDPKAGISMEAHSLYLQELTRFGIIGFTAQFLFLALGLGLAAVAAYRGLAWPLAILFAYYVASMTEVFQDGWLDHSFYSLLILLSVLASGWWLKRDSPGAGATAPGTGA